MASILPFGRRKQEPVQPSAAKASPALERLLDGFSIEVMPRTAEKIDDFRELLPQNTRVYLAHIDGTPFEDMAATAKRLVGEGFEVMPHLPARSIADRQTFQTWVKTYADLGISSALVLAGGISTPRGAFHSSMQLLETGILDENGFNRLHVAGHPEGNRDIDADGGEKTLMEALAFKQAFSERSDAQMAIVTQFLFEAVPAISWANRLTEAGITMPVHLGVAGPAKLQTLIKFALACGVGPSLSVLQKRAKDISKLMVPFAPDEVLSGVAEHLAAHPDSNIQAIHFFPLGGIKACANYVAGAKGSAQGASSA